MKRKYLVSVIMIVILSICECTTASAGWFQDFFGGGSNTNSNVNKNTSSSVKPAQKPNTNTKAQEYVAKYGYDAEEIFEFWGENTGVDYKMSSKARTFLREHPEMFMGTAAERKKASDYIDSNIRWEYIEKNASLYGDKTLLVKDANLHQIFEHEVDKNGNLYSQLNVVDDDGNRYYVYYFGTLSGLYADTQIDVIGLPMAFSHFDNTTGGQTLVVVVAGCVVGKTGTLNISTKNNSNTVASKASSNQQKSNNYVTAGDPPDDDEYILWGSDSGYFDRSYLESLSNAELRLARNEIYARHGRKFDSKDLQDYFNSKSWYVGRYSPKEFDALESTILNKWEKANRDLIVQIENSRK